VPLLKVEHSGPVPVVLTSLEFPHRYADAYLRDSLLDGVAFDKTELGRSLMAASLDDASALYARDPGSLVYGAWNSHRKGRPQKFPRVYASEVIGWDPVLGARNAGRMDPLNLQGAQKPSKSGEGWDFAPVAQKVKGEKLSEIGHGNVAPNPQHGGVTIHSASDARRCRSPGWTGSGSVPRPPMRRRRRGRSWPRTRFWPTDWRLAARACGCAAGASWCWSPSGSSG
jgi:CRISPR-associated protein Csb1